MTITELLDELRVPYRRAGESPHVTANWIGIECPFCGVGTGKTGLGISISRHNCSCWKCGPHRLGDVLLAVTGLPWGRIKPLLTGLVTLTPRPARQPGKLCLPAGLGPLEHAHKRYLTDRGLDPDTLVRLWEVGGLGLAAGKLAWRVFIPIRQDGQTVSWTTRSIAPDARLRYLSAAPHQEAVPRSSCLFGGDYVRHAVIVTEGSFDTMRIGPGAVATMGLAYSREQVAELVKVPYRYICFDNEPGAQRRARQLAAVLRPYPGKTAVIQIDAPDPGSASDREITQLRKLLGD